MEWRDTGAVLAARKHGENSAVLEVFTETRGRHAGVVRGAASRKNAANLEPGTQVSVTWRERLEEHLGSFTIEPIKSRAASVMSGRRELAALNAVTGLLSFALPEREPHPRLYAGTLTMLDLIGENDAWPVAYMHWELALLEALGFGLDLTTCAVTGVNDGLKYVSPRTGRAVSEEGAGEWKDRLLPLPSCVSKPLATTTLAEVEQGLKLSGHFLKSWLAPSLGERPLPAARQRLVDLLTRDRGHSTMNTHSSP